LANNSSNRSSLEDANAKTDLAPDAASAAQEVNPANDGRSLDIGESGQFAPGGYYNQHGEAESDRLDLDEGTATHAAGNKS
jgi:hypothetical protein